MYRFKNQYWIFQSWLQRNKESLDSIKEKKVDLEAVQP